MLKSLFVLLCCLQLWTINNTQEKKSLREKHDLINYAEVLPDDYEMDSFVATTANHISKEELFKIEGVHALAYLGKCNDKEMYSLYTDKLNKSEILKFIDNLYETGYFEIVEPDQDIHWFYLPNEYVGDGPNGDWYYTYIDLDKAWDIETVSNTPKVGVIDTGIYGSHQDLSSRLNTSASHSLSPNSSNALAPAHFHGTWVAGIIGAKSDNGVGTAGVLCNNNLQIVSLRVDGEAAGFIEIAPDQTQYQMPGYQEKLSLVIGMMNYVESISTIIHVLNFSGGFPFPSLQLKNSIQAYDGLFVCAAGNAVSGTHITSQTQYVYPGYYNLDNMITVTASNNQNNIPNFACYNSYVHVAAPGVSIAGCKYNSTTDKWVDSGTSASAPIVAGIAAMLKGIKSSLTTAQIKSIILDTVIPNSNFTGKCTSGGIVNAFRAALKAVPLLDLNNCPISMPYYSNNTIPPYKFHWYRINSKPGNFNFTTTGYLYTKAELYSANDLTNYVIDSSGYGQGHNFSLNYTFTNSSEYYLKVYNTNSVTGPYTVSVTEY